MSTPEEPKSGELRQHQAKRAAAERELADDSLTPDEEQQHQRRADKASYLAKKLAERERSERDTE